MSTTPRTAAPETATERRDARRPRGHPALRAKLRRDVLRQWPQFLALMVTVLLGVALFAASYDAYRNLQASYDGIFADERFADLFVTGPDAATYADAARATDGVAAVATRTQSDLPFAVGSEKLRGRVIGYPAAGDPAVDRVTLLRGSGLAGPDTALVEQHMADHFGLGPGDTVTVQGADGPSPVRVTGVVSSAEYLWPARSRQDPFPMPSDFGVLFVAEPAAQALAGADAPNQALVRLSAAARGTGLLDDLSAQAVAAGASEALTRAEQPSNTLLQVDIAGFRELALAFPLLFLSAAAMATYVLLTRRVQSERPVIGVLRAQGMRRRTLVAHYLGYGVAAGVLGAAAGVVLGIAGARGLTQVYLEELNLPVEAAVLGGVRAVTLLGGLAFGVGFTALAAAAPALAAARVPPAAAMRGDMPTGGGRRTLAERAFPVLRRAPAWWRMVLRGIGRSRRRTAFTAAGVALALLLVVASWTMLDTMSGQLRTQFDEVARQDAQVAFAEGAGPDELAALRATPGVAAAEPLVEQPVLLAHGDRSLATVLYGMEPGTRMHGFRLTGGGAGSLPTDGILVGQALRDETGAAVGDEVTLRLPALGTQVRARVAGLLDEPLGTFAYASAGWLDARADGAAATSALLEFTPDADPEEVRREVTALPGVAAYTDSAALERLWDDYAGLFYAFIGGMLVLSGLMAFAIVFTTMSVNIIERRREMATLRAAGVRYRTLARLVAGENMLVALLGVLPGLALGVAAGAALLESFSSDQFQLSIVVRPTTLVLAAAAMLAVAAASQWPGLRAIRRMDVAEVVRERVG